MWLSFEDSADARTKMAMLEPGDTALQAPPASPVGASRTKGSAHPLDVAMDRYARGDDAAFEDLYRLGAPQVRRFLMRLCGDASTADDLAQEAFLRVHRARGSFARGAAAVPWVLAIARNAFLDDVRRARSRPRARGTEEEVARHEGPPGARGDEALVAREMADVVTRALQALPVLQREAFILLVAYLKMHTAGRSPEALTVGLAAPFAAGAIALAAGTRPGPRGLGPPKTRVALAAVLGPVLFVVLSALLLERDASDGLYWRRALGCAITGAGLAAAPVGLVALAWRRAFVAAAPWRTAALGVACGALATAALSLVCPVATAWHVVVGHGAAMIAGGVVGAAIARWTATA